MAEKDTVKKTRKAKTVAEAPATSDEKPAEDEEAAKPARTIRKAALKTSKAEAADTPEEPKQDAPVADEKAEPKKRKPKTIKEDSNASTQES